MSAVGMSRASRTALAVCSSGRRAGAGPRRRLPPVRPTPPVAHAPGVVDLTRGDNTVRSTAPGKRTTVRATRPGAAATFATEVDTIHAAELVPEPASAGLCGQTQ